MGFAVGTRKTPIPSVRSRQVTFTLAPKIYLPSTHQRGHVLPLLQRRNIYIYFFHKERRPQRSRPLTLKVVGEDRSEGPESGEETEDEKKRARIKDKGRITNKARRVERYTLLHLVHEFQYLVNRTVSPHDESYSPNYFIPAQSTKPHVCLIHCFNVSSVQFSSVQDGNYPLGKAHIRSTPSLRSFPNVAIETVPMFKKKKIFF